jgi:hypothetical protein
MAPITRNIPTPDVPIIELRTGLIAPDWYDFLRTLSVRFSSGPITITQTDPHNIVSYPSFGTPPPSYYAANSILVTWADKGVAVALIAQSVLETTATPDPVNGASGGGVWGGVTVKAEGLDPWGVIGVLNNTLDVANASGAGVWGLIRGKGGLGTGLTHAIRSTSETDGTDHPEAGLYVYNHTSTNAFLNGAWVVSAVDHGFVVGTDRAPGGVMPAFPFAYYSVTDVRLWAVDINGHVRSNPQTVASLPAAGTAGRRAFVSDANATTFASVAAGGGTNKVPVYDDGASWRIG